VNNLVSWEEIREHLFKPFPDGFYSSIEKRVDVVWFWLYFLSTLMFLWIAINMGPGMFRMGIIYTVMGVLGISLMMVEWLKPRGSFWGAACGWHSPSMPMDELVMLGFLIGSLFLFLEHMVGGFAVWSLTAQEAFTNAILLVWAIPIIESGFFAGVLTPSFVERHGVVYGIMAVAVLWALFHLATWGVSLDGVLLLELYRLVTSFTVVKYRSMLPSLVAHVVVNAGVFFVGF